jgi:hypothetical protein
MVFICLLFCYFCPYFLFRLSCFFCCFNSPPFLVLFLSFFLCPFSFLFFIYFLFFFLPLFAYLFHCLISSFSVSFLPPLFVSRHFGVHSTTACSSQCVQIDVFPIPTRDNLCFLLRGHLVFIFESMLRRLRGKKQKKDERRDGRSASP